MTKEGPKKYKVKSTATTFRIIEILRKRDGTDLSELATELELAKSTVHNYIATMKRMGYVVEEGGVYYPGFRFLEVGTYVKQRKDEYAMVERKVDELVEETGERGQFIVNGNGIGVCLHTARGNHGVDILPEIGSAMYLHASAAGKALLAAMDEQQVEQVIQKWGLPELTDRTITDEAELFRELGDIREQGYAKNDGQMIEQVRAVGVTIQSPYDQLIGSISIGGPTYRIKDAFYHETLPDLLLGVKNELEVNITHS